MHGQSLRYKTGNPLIGSLLEFFEQGFLTFLNDDLACSTGLKVKGSFTLVEILHRTVVFQQRDRLFSISASVTRLGDFFNFGQLFKAFGNNQFAQIFHILRQFL